ncbi:MAG: two-component system, sporulation sensor kinase [Clostridia bacterium]|nr:two-component system, sporulation sensor kinase [Clostridia bacterium]
MPPKCSPEREEPEEKVRYYTEYEEKSQPSSGGKLLGFWSFGHYNSLLFSFDTTLYDLLLDEKEIRQLILNLAHNGLEAMKFGGYLTIKTYMDGEEVVLAVQDEGKGIDSNIVNKLETPFLTTKETGTGLGLTVCYNIADNHNAVINFESDIYGTTFFVRFKKHI